MSFKVEINKDECIGCGACVATCPDNFEMDGDKAIAKQSQVDDGKSCQEAADGCPVSCIKVTQLK